MTNKQKIILAAGVCESSYMETIEDYITRSLPANLVGKIDFIHSDSATDLILQLNAMTPTEKCYVRSIFIFDRINQRTLYSREEEEKGVSKALHQQLVNEGLPRDAGYISPWLAKKLEKIEFGNKRPTIKVLTVTAAFSSERFEGINLIDLDDCNAMEQVEHAAVESV